MKETEGSGRQTEGFFEISIQLIPTDRMGDWTLHLYTIEWKLFVRIFAVCKSRWNIRTRREKIANETESSGFSSVDV